GTVTMTPPPQDTYVISGVESATKILFNQGDLVFINRGAKQGVQPGAEFLVSRKINNRAKTQWFVWQNSLMRAMGDTWADIGRLRVVHVEQETSTAEIVQFCDRMQRGDTVVPFAARQVPTYKPAAKLDVFAPPTGKEMAMVVATRDAGEIAAAG